jgi:hypothetical protein
MSASLPSPTDTAANHMIAAPKLAGAPHTPRPSTSFLRSHSHILLSRVGGRHISRNTFYHISSPHIFFISLHIYSLLVGVWRFGLLHFVFLLFHFTCLLICGWAGGHTSCHLSHISAFRRWEVGESGVAFVCFATYCILRCICFLGLRHLSLLFVVFH